MGGEEFGGDVGGLPAGIAAGSLIAGYRLEKQVGAGGMAVVFRARDERLDRLVALKIMSPALGADESFRRRFIRESRAAAAADDPHIIPVFEAGEAGGVLFIAMRYVPGGDVRTMIGRAGPLSAARTAAIISPVASALDAAHAAGLVHRDVKPANMLLDSRPGRPDHVYLSDFGLSKGSLSAAGLTKSGHFLGTPDYSAPEQIAGQPVDGRADQYSLACAAFELLSGAPPYPREHATAVIWAHMSQAPPPVTSRRAGLPPAVDLVLTRALAKAPGDRYASCREFADALRAALGLAPYDVASEIIHETTEPADNQGADTETAGRRRGPEATPPPGAQAEITAPRPVIQHPAGPATASQHRAGAPAEAPAEGTGPAGPSGPGRVTRRTLLLAGAAGAAAAGVGAVLWATGWPGAATGRPGATTGPGRTRGHSAKTAAPSRRSSIWQASVPFGPGAVMTVAGGVVAMVGGLGPHDGNVLQALNASDGSSAWSFTTRIGAIAILAATADEVFLDTPLCALSSSDGTTLWTSPLAPTYGPVAAGGSVYAGTGSLWALRGSDGTELWTYPADVTCEPVVAGDVIYVLGAKNGPDGSVLSVLHALRASDGTLIWDTPGPNGGSLTTDGDIVCGTDDGPTGSSPTYGGRLWAWRASDGTRLWISDADGGFGTPAMAAGIVYAVNAAHELVALRASDGKNLWSYPATAAVAPATANGVVYAGNSAGELIALRASDGTLLWHFPARFSIGPVVAGNAVYVSDGTKVYAVPA